LLIIIRKSFGVKEFDSKSYERHLLTTALNLIIINKNAIIHRLKNINIDIIKQIFLKEAYQWAKRYVQPIKINKDGSESSNLQDIVDKDPFYAYLYQARILEYLAGKSKKFPSSKYDFTTILGRNSEQISSNLNKGIPLYYNVKAPEQWSFGDKEFDEYSYQSFMMIYEFIENKIYEKVFVPRSIIAKNYFKQFANVLEIQNSLAYQVQEKYIHPMFKVDLLIDLTKYLNFSNINIYQHFCKDGRKHAPNKKLFSDGKKDMLVSQNEIIEWLKNDDERIYNLYGMSLVNEKCDLCGKYVRDMPSESISIEEMFGSIDDRIAFHSYYSIRCPESNLHDIKDGRCVKCGLNTEKDHDKTKDDAYYKKYIAKFKAIEKEKQKISIESLEEVQKLVKSTYKKVQLPEYKISLTHIAEWSKLTGIKYNVLVNIGLFDDEKFENIATAKTNPSKYITDDKTYVKQAIRLKNHMLNLIREYNMFLNHNSVPDLPIELKEILERQKKITINNLKGSMATIGNGFIEKDNEYKFFLSHEKYANFMHQTLAGSIVSISETKKEYKTMAYELVVYFTKKILEKEKLFCSTVPIFAKTNIDITTLENESDNSVSGDDFDYRPDPESEKEFSDDKPETYNNDLGDFNDAYDVENAGDIWDIDE
jgi:hypothetical protein